MDTGHAWRKNTKSQHRAAAKRAREVLACSSHRAAHRCAGPVVPANQKAES
jgi:hypothetical protein